VRNALMMGTGEWGEDLVDGARYPDDTEPDDIAA
jgi:hypothetical protein